MRRFARRRRSASSAGSSAAPIDAAHWMQRIVDEKVVAVSSLTPMAPGDVPASYAAIGAGENEDGSRLVVAFAPVSGGDAVLAALAVAGRLAEEEGFAGDVVAVSPHWTTAARRRLGLVGELPYRLRAVAAHSLLEGTRDVEPESATEMSVVPVSAIAGHLARPADRELFSRAVSALEGLASKHGGAIRGVGRSVELMLLARRVAELRADESGVLLNTILPQKATVRVSADDLSGALDALEGQLRKRLNDRRARDGEEGLRTEAIPLFRAWHSLRALTLWPWGGTDGDPLDLVGVDVAGQPVIGAARKELTLESLGAILDAVAFLRPFLPIVLSRAAAPVRLEAPRLMLAAKRVAAGVARALPALCVAHELFELRSGPDRHLELAVLGSGGASQPVREPASGRAAPTQAAPTAEADVETGDVEATEGVETEGRSRSRRRGRRGRGGRSSSEPSPDAGAVAEEPASEEPVAGEVETGTGTPMPQFDEISLLDLDTSEEPVGVRRKRGRSRRRGRRASSGSGEEESASGESTAAEEEAPSEESARPPRRRRRGRHGEAVVEDEREVLLEDSTDEIDGSLADIPDDVPELDEVADGKRAAADRQPDPEEEELEVELEEEEEEASPEQTEVEAVDKDASKDAPRVRRRRAVILAHADRDSLIAATLLARDIRLIEGVWIYSQAELMTFFRSVATDLREQTPIYVVGFTASPARDVLQAVALYQDRLTWFDHHDWPPEDLDALQQSIGSEALHVTPGIHSSVPCVIDTCTRRSRFSDKLVDLVCGRFTQHDYERWGRLWWWRFGKMAEGSGEIRADLAPLLAGRPSDLAKEAVGAETPPPPPEVEYVSGRDFRLVHFGGHSLIVVNVEGNLDTLLCSRIARERYDAPLSLAYREGDDLVVFAGEELSGRRAFDLMAVVEHMAEKLEWVEARVASDHVARFRVRDLEKHAERLDEVIGEIAMGRSILER